MIQLHIAVFLFGLSGLFGKVLPIDASSIVLGRTLIAAAAILLFLCIVQKKKVQIGAVVKLFPAGALLAAHWFAFFHSIQLSTVAVGLVSFATFPIFVALCDPFFTKCAIRRIDLVCALLVVVGLVLIVPTFELTNTIFRGAMWGVGGAIAFAALTLFNKHVTRQDAVVAGFGQNFWAAVCFTPFYPSLLGLKSVELLSLMFLGIFCTAVAHILFISSLQKMRSQLVSITACLEPVYGILLAFAILGERPTLREVLGGTIILVVVALLSWFEQDRDSVSAASHSVAQLGD